MPDHDEEIIIDEDGPEADPAYFSEPVFHIRGRVIPRRKSPLEPVDPELLALIKSKSPLVQMSPDILCGMPVFYGTNIPIKRMFDCLLAGKPLEAFLRDYPDLSRLTATQVLESDTTLFYEAISKAIDSAAMPSSRPR